MDFFRVIQEDSPSGQPSIELFGLTIMEPMVTLTDFWITGVALFAFWKLRNWNQPGAMHAYMRWYFLLMGIATFFGGLLGHAFQHVIGLEWKLPGWLISMLAVSAIERSTIQYVHPLIPSRFAKLLEVANILELIIFAVITFTTLDFFYIKVHSAYGLGLIVLPLHAYAWWKTRNQGSRIIALSVCFASIAAITYTTKIGLHTWFNHLDVSHTVMAISLYFFYRGTLHLGQQVEWPGSHTVRTNITKTLTVSTIIAGSLVSPAMAQQSKLDLTQDQSAFVEFHLEQTDRAYLDATYNAASRRTEYEFGATLQLEDTTGQALPLDAHVTIHTAYYDGYSDYKTRLVVIISGVNVDEALASRPLTKQELTSHPLILAHDSIQTSKQWSHIKDSVKGLTGLSFYVIDKELQAFTDRNTNPVTLTFGSYRMTIQGKDPRVLQDLYKTRYPSGL